MKKGGKGEDAKNGQLSTKGIRKMYFPHFGVRNRRKKNRHRIGVLRATEGKCKEEKSSGLVLSTADHSTKKAGPSEEKGSRGTSYLT